MANILVAYPDFTQPTALYTPTVTGGSFLAALPDENMADRRLHLPARTSDDAVTSSVFTWDLGVDRAVRCLAALTNISSVGTIRVRGFTAVPVLDSLDFSTGWTSTGTPTLVAAAYDGSGADGVPLDLVGDDDAAVNEGRLRVITFTGDGTKCISFRLKADTAPSSVVVLFDNTAAATRLRVTVTWTAGVPSANASTGTVLSTTLIGDGVYRFVVATTSVTAANTNELIARPASNAASDVTITGTTYMGAFLAWNAATDQLVYDTGCELAIPSGLDAEESEGLNVWWSHIPSAAQTARYWRVNINDTTNADTFIDVYRMFIGGGFQPTVNVSVGCELNFDDPSIGEDTDGGATIFDERRQRRELVGVLEMMTEAEAYGDWFDIKRKLGRTGQLFVALDPDDADTLRWKRAFLATQAEVNGISHPAAFWHDGKFRFREEL